MGGENERAFQKAAGQHATEMAVPGVTMNHIDVIYPLQMPQEVFWTTFLL